MLFFESVVHTILLLGLVQSFVCTETVNGKFTSVARVLGVEWLVFLKVERNSKYKGFTCTLRYYL